MSMISELIEELIDNADLYTKELHDLMYRAADTIEMLSEKARGQEWIPCSERLPSEKEWTDSYIRNKKASEFFVMIKGADRPTTLYLSRDHYWFDENRNFYEVVAWMLMPDLPKGADDE